VGTPVVVPGSVGHVVLDGVGTLLAVVPVRGKTGTRAEKIFGADMVIPVGEGTGGQKSGGDGYNGRPKGVGFKRIVTLK
jgi:hypothetical protein